MELHVLERQISRDPRAALSFICACFKSTKKFPQLCGTIATEDFCMKMTCLVNCGNFLLFRNYDKATTTTELIDISFNENFSFLFYFIALQSSFYELREEISSDMSKRTRK